MELDSQSDRTFFRIKTVARHTAVYGFFDALGRAGALILVPLYARLLGPAEYGVLELFTVTYALLLVVVVLGMNSALTRYYVTAKSELARAEYFRTALTLVGGVALVVTLGLMLMAPQVARLIHGDASLAGLWRILFLTVFLDAVMSLALALFRAQERPVRYSVINLTRFLTILLLNVVLVGFLRQGVLGALTSTLVGAFVGAGLGLFLARSYVRIAIDPERLRQMAHFGLPLVVVGGAVFVLTSADRYFLKFYWGTAPLGIYALAYKIGMIMSMVVNAFAVAWQPLLLRIIQDEEAKETLGKVLLYYLLGSSFLLIGLGSFSPEIVGLLATPAFGPAGPVVPFILASYMLYGVYYFFTLGSVVLERTRLIAANVLVAMVINLVANSVLIPPFGIMGAATATVLSYLALAIGMFLVSQRLYPVPVPVVRILGLGAVVAAILLVNCYLAPSGTGWGWAVKLVTIALFLPAASWLRILGGEDRRRIHALLRRNLKRR